MDKAQKPSDSELERHSNLDNILQTFHSQSDNHRVKIKRSQFETRETLWNNLFTLHKN
jgi:hypothetical protein